MSSFTPGPWHVEASLISDGGYVIADDEMGLSICARSPWPTRIDESHANARLIAAAPEMLAALKDAMRSSRKDFKGPDGDRQHREAYAEQFAAIAKAEGRP